MTEEELNSLPFDEALQRLEQLVSQLEGGRLTLEESLQAFDDGMKLHRICADKLGQARKKIELLVKNSAGEWNWQEQSPTAQDENQGNPSDGQ